jgi:hypothetical protein
MGADLHTLPASWLRLAGHVLDLYSDGQVARGCDDLAWPEWFPVSEREPLVREMERWNGPEEGREKEIAATVALYAPSASAPPAWWIAGFFAGVLTKAGGGAP